MTLRKRVRVVAVLLVLSLLIAALPGTTGNTQSVKTTNAVSKSLSAQVFRDVRAAVASLGGWIAEKLNPSSTQPPVIANHPVTAFIPPPPFLDAPTALTVTAAADTSVSLSWTAPAGSVDHYQIERSANVSGPFLFLANSVTTTYQDTTVSSDHSYLYRVRAITAGGLPSAPSNMAVGTASSFEFTGTAQLQSQLVKKQHVYDIRTAINALRTIANLSQATWTRTDLTNLQIAANDIQEMRDRLNEALTVLSVPVTAFQDATLSTGAGGTQVKAVHIDQLQTRSTRGSSTSSGPIDSDASTARLDPLNETGGGSENPLSRNFNWNLPLVSLPGRAGMDLGLSLSYNSLVWTASGSSVSFDDDHGFPGPGFRLGFPVIQPSYYNTEVGKYAFLLIGVDGSRTELRQVGSSALYEAADSSHLLLDTATMKLRSADGTQLSYALKGGEYKCTEIKDTNGNYITINYTTGGSLQEVIDTLGRTITFEYDVNGWLTGIKQTWAGPVTHYWARFDYTNTTIDTNFPGLTIYGPADTTQIKTLSKVTLADDSHYDFTYSTWGQVWKITRFDADNNAVNYHYYNLPQTGSAAHQDCPRFTARYDWAKYWNGDTDGTPATGEEASTAFMIPTSDTWTMPDTTSKSGVRAQVTTADGTITKFYFVGTAGSNDGWSRGLPLLVDTIVGTDIKRRVVTTWTQDNTLVSYPLNPRVTETNIHDDANNRVKTTIAYQQFAFTNGTNCWLPRDFFEYLNPTTVLRTTRTNFISSTSYTDRRILGLTSERLVYEGDVNNGGVLKQKFEYLYDESGSIQGNDAPIQHDNTNFTSSFVTGRANLSTVRRYNVDNLSQFTPRSSKYNTAGAVVSATDASTHTLQISYADSFSDNNNSRNTFAYPTTVTDPDGYTATSKYNFDFGALTYNRTPQPNVITNTPGPEQTFTFDGVGRLQQVTNVVNNAHVRFVYTNLLRVDTYVTIQEGLDEAHSFRITDGAGRVIGTASDHPGSIGGFSGTRMLYDVMGRVIKTSNPTETSASGTPFQWTTAGDDAAAGWIYTEQTYDWKGRPLVTTYPSVTGNPADTTTKTASYSGCGCAGGQVVTVTDEGTIDAGTPKRRQKKIYSDVLGRTVKAETLNWEGGSVYSATVNTYNVRDQITAITEYAGPVGGGTTSQVTSMTYDGYGRLQTRHLPEQQVDPNNANSTDHSTWTYNADDTINTITDARGAVTTFSYTGNNRHLPTSTTHTLSGSPTISNTYAYDAVGNRTSVTDGLGSMAYTYDSLSQLTAETRTFTGVNSFTINYDYNLAGQLKSVTDPFGAQVGYTHDLAGRVTNITGSNFASVSSYASNMTYRAWGGLKSLTYGNSKTLAVGYDAKLKVSTYEVPGIMKKAYTYYNDGRLKFTQDQLVTNSKFDRLSKYDHVGRITKALSGLEAREAGTTNDRPYNETMTYDAFGHLTSRNVLQWDRSQSSGTMSYVNNRNNFWHYDADGRVLQGDSNYTYDASGAIASFGDADPYVTEQQFDGLGRRAKTVLKSQDPNTLAWTTEKVTYYVSSTVFGKVMSEVSETGAKEQSSVFAGASVFAIQHVDAGGAMVTWEHYDASGASYRGTDAQGLGAGSAEMDPFGANAGLFKPFTWPPPKSTGEIEPFYGIPELNSATQGCVLDRVPISCDQLQRLMEAGGVRQEYVAPVIPDRKIPGLPPPPPVLRVVDVDIIPRGMGLFEVGIPKPLDADENRRPDFDYFVFAFGPQDPVPQPPPEPPEPGQPLSQCVKNRLRPYFPGVDLDKIRIHSGIPSYVVGDNLAYTDGNDIYFKEGLYDPNSVQGLADIGHEVTHSEQYAKLGTLKFRAQYLGEYANNVHSGMDHQTAYESISFEVEARKKAAIISKDLSNLMKQVGGREPCPK
ncbi:MAG TPA: DUF4157 domain-containing protein [Pyrinomonadaceae bacterium]|nr:DUF4157 domain-containing protein [Pyrinomonadaceae bacterium]